MNLTTTKAGEKISTTLKSLEFYILLNVCIMIKKANIFYLIKSTIDVPMTTKLCAG
jgi:hypothetical protein